MMIGGHIFGAKATIGLVKNALHHACEISISDFFGIPEVTGKSSVQHFPRNDNLLKETTGDDLW